MKTGTQEHGKQAVSQKHASEEGGSDAASPTSDDSGKSDSFGRHPTARASKKKFSLTRALGLVNVRESDLGSKQLFDGMRAQTYMALSHIPSMREILRIGLEPMLTRDGTVTIREDHEDGSWTDHCVVVQQLRLGRAKAWLFFYRGYWHLWSMSSAAQTNSAGDNDFTKLLCRQIKTLRPMTVYAYSVSRLMRSQEHGLALQRTLMRYVDTVVADRSEFAMKGREASMGRMMLQQMGHIAAMERDWIVTRTVAGKVSKWRRGEWTFGKAAVPPGYKLDAATKRLVVDPEARDVVRQMLFILAGDAPPTEMARQLGAAGLKTRATKTDEQYSVDTLRTPKSLLDRLYAWGAVWVQGEFLLRLTNPFPELDTFSGLEVKRFKTTKRPDRGELQMLCKLPLPNGGWADSDVLKSFERKLVSNSESLVGSGRSKLRRLSAQVKADSVNPALHDRLLTARHRRGDDDLAVARREGPRAKSTMAPFTGRQWIDGDFRYELQSAHKGSYRVARWPLESARTALTKRPVRWAKKS